MNTPPDTAPSGAPRFGPMSPLQSRATDDARERAIAILTDRYAEGALDDTALERYLDRLHAASSVEAVRALATELSSTPAPAPEPVTMPAAAVGPSVLRRRILAFMSEAKRAGRWIVPRELRVLAIMSDVKLDLRDAILPPETTVDVTAFMASVKLTVPPGLPVSFDTDGITIMAATGSAATEPDESWQGPIVRVVGSAFMGEVRVLVKGRKDR